ncbi:olfactory receptor 8B3-like [Cavia porcellus]|uniref:olfactory receptor 8B3-like n=1 Tax=Cavia porcellus TaxID=10141 RepID=UPI002FE10DF1
MYYFLFNLSSMDLCYSSVFTPQMLVNFVSKKNGISYAGCITQLFFFLFFVISECYMLTAMTYNCYLAICHPLLCEITRPQKVCSGLSLAPYTMGFSGASAHTGCLLLLTFFRASVINHYLCDILSLLQLSCTRTYVNEEIVLIVVGVNITVLSVITLISYTFLLTSFLCINSTQRRSKAFSSCCYHIIAISFFLRSAAFMQLKCSFPEFVNQGKGSFVFCTNVKPTLNTLICSLKKDVKIALRKVGI